VELARAADTLPYSERPRFPFMVAFSEPLTPAHRAYITKIFKGEVYNRYGLSELNNVGEECEQHEGFHLDEDKHIIEVVDGAGRPVLPGTAGRIVVTHFYNFVMPFIRYDTGDYGSILSEPCVCGVPTRRLRLDGRTTLFLEMNRQKISHVEIGGILRYFGESILRYQVAKTSQDAAELRIIPVPGAMPDCVLLREKFFEQFGLRPTTRMIEKIVFTDRGKTPVIVDETMR
jgi:phenylacetate-CoA ligase